MTGAASSVGGESAHAAVAAARRDGRARSLTVSVALALAAFLLLCLSISVGSFPVPLHDVVPAILGTGSPEAEIVVQTLRLPRALGALLVGIAFGMSGAVFQSLVRNELASPDIIGITAGAGAAAVLSIVIAGATSGGIAMAAFAGALGTAFAIYLLAYRSGLSQYRLILVGIGTAAALESITAFVLTRSDLFELRRATVWLTGDLNGIAWPEVRTLATALAVLVPAMLALLLPLRALGLGDDLARGVGVRLESVRAAAIACACGLAAFAIAAAGPITFVAFVSAPIARRLTRGGDLALLPAALTGAVLLLAADLLARLAPGTLELPVGVITGILGAPYLVWLLVRDNRGALVG